MKDDVMMEEHDGRDDEVQTSCSWECWLCAAGVSGNPISDHSIGAGPSRNNILLWTGDETRRSVVTEMGLAVRCGAFGDDGTTTTPLPADPAA